MTDIAKLEHIIKLVTDYQNEVSRSEQSYKLAVHAYASFIMDSNKKVSINDSEYPKPPITIEENCSNYLKRIKGILEDCDEYTSI